MIRAEIISFPYDEWIESNAPMRNSVEASEQCAAPSISLIFYSERERKER